MRFGIECSWDMSPVHDPQELLRATRTDEVGVLAIGALDLLDRLQSNQDYRKGIEPFGAVDGEVADALVLASLGISVFGEGESAE